MTVTRLDDGGERMYLYLDDKDSYIEGHIRGFHGIMDGYIKFGPDYIEVWTLEGAFKKVGDDPRLRLHHLTAEEQMALDLETYNRNNQGSLMELFGNTNYERRGNPRIHCQVKAIYDSVLMASGN